MTAKIESAKSRRYFVSTDNSSHRYLIPLEKRAEWDAFCELPEDDERSWVVPEWAERLDGVLLSFEKPEVIR